MANSNSVLFLTLFIVVLSASIHAMLLKMGPLPQHNTLQQQPLKRLQSPSTSTRLLIGVLSARGHSERRLAQRETWVGEARRCYNDSLVKIVFVLGDRDCRTVPNNLSATYHHECPTNLSAPKNTASNSIAAAAAAAAGEGNNSSDGNAKTHHLAPHSSAYARLDWARRRLAIHKSVQAEQEKYNDLLILPGHVDTYRALPKKLLGLIRFAQARNSNATLLMKTDDDTFVDVHRLMKILRIINREHCHFANSKSRASSSRRRSTSDRNCCQVHSNVHRSRHTNIVNNRDMTIDDATNDHAVSSTTTTVAGKSDSLFHDYPHINTNVEAAWHRAREIAWQGAFRVNWPVARTGKWAELASYGASTYPAFACGAGSILGHRLIDWITYQDRHQALTPLQGEDVSLGVWLAAALPVTPRLVHDTRFLCLPGACQSNMIVSPTSSTAQLRLMWRYKTECGDPCHCGM